MVFPTPVLFRLSTFLPTPSKRVGGGKEKELKERKYGEDLPASGLENFGRSVTSCLWCYAYWQQIFGVAGRILTVRVPIGSVCVRNPRTGCSASAYPRHLHGS